MPLLFHLLKALRQPRGMKGADSDCRLLRAITRDKKYTDALSITPPVFLPVGKKSPQSFMRIFMLTGVDRMKKNVTAAMPAVRRRAGVCRRKCTGLLSAARRFALTACMIRQTAQSSSPEQSWSA